MSNPLIDKYEELYGEKKEEEIVEEKKSPLSVKEMRERFASSVLPGGMGDDHIIFGGGGSDTITLNPAHMNPGLTINGGQEILDSGAFVIPAATVSNGVMNMDGSYISPSTLMGTTITSPTQNTFTIPNNGVKDEMLCKVLKDVENGKAIVYNISSQVDKSFTGFGGQICYSIEIVSTYP